MTRRTPQIAPVVVKRAAEARKRLPPELEAFARSDEERLRIRKPRQDRGKLNDPREGYTIPGVANRDARTVYDQRVTTMQKLWNDGAADEAALEDLGTLLFDARRLELWRARRVMDFEAFVEEVVGLPLKRAQELLDAAALRLREPLERLSERDVALWLRTEAGLFEGDLSASARIVNSGGKTRLTLSVSLEHASDALAGVGSRHMPLSRPTEERLGGLAGVSAGQAAPVVRSKGEKDRPERRVEAQAELEEASAELEGADGADAQEGSDETPAWKPAPPVEGGARLLTRKARPEPSEAGEASEPRKFQRPERAGRDGQAGRGERGDFGRGREGGREGGAPRFGGERGNFGRGREGGREGGAPRFGGGRREGGREGGAPRFGGGRREGGREGGAPRFGGGRREGSREGAERSARSFERDGERRAAFGRADVPGRSTRGAGFGEKREFGGKPGAKAGFGNKGPGGKGGFGKGGFGKGPGGKGGFGKGPGGKGGFGKGGFGKGGFGKGPGAKGGFGKGPGAKGGFGKGGFGKKPRAKDEGGDE